MPNIAKLLKDEIQRLARREIKLSVSGLRKDNVALKRTAADLKKRMAKLESVNKRMVKAQAISSDAPAQASNGSKARISGKAIRSIRTRLGLSQGDFARLVGVSSQSVFHYEHAIGRLKFRGDTKERIVAIRDMGKRKVKEALERLAS